MFQITSGELHTEANTEAQRLATEALLTALDENVGIEVVMEAQEAGLRIVDRNVEMMAVDYSTEECKKKVSDATVQINNRLEELNRSEVEAQSWHTQNENPVSSLDHDGQPSPSNEGDKGAEASDAKLNKNLHPSNILTQKMLLSLII